MSGARAFAGSDVSFADVTTIHPIGALAVVVLGLATLMVPRRYVLVPMFLMVCFIAPAQRVVVLSLDFSLLRIMVLFVAARFLMRREYSGFVWGRLDTLFVAVWAANALVYTLQWSTMGALVNRLGVGFEAMGVYFLARVALKDWDDLRAFVRIAALTSVPVAGFFLLESQTRYNVFSVFGGVPEITTIREGRLRCQGPFSHPIIAGVFWASLMPLIASQWWQGKHGRSTAVIGICSGVIIVYCCASSTPVLALVAGIVGAAFYRVRGRMKDVVLGTIIVLFGLHMVMNAPVWHLIARVSAVGGSTGWHRYNLIDKAIHNFTEWAVLGVRTTGHWGWGLQDVTNQYVLYAVTGGAVTLVLFIGLLVVAFRGTGGAVSRLSDDRPRQIMAWAVGVMLFVHCVCFIGVSYFGQANVVWYLSLAIAANVATVSAPRRSPARAPAKLRCASGVSGRGSTQWPLAIKPD